MTVASPGRALVTGAAGFIGSHVVDVLLGDGWDVVAVDNFDPFYSATLKRANVERHRRHSRFRLHEVDVTDRRALEAVPGAFDVVVHLAAKVGVRPSIVDPQSYQHVNVTGTETLLELARARGVPQFVFGSSSSVYGLNPHVPWVEDDDALQPISPYATTKVSGERLGHEYSTLYGMRFVALRFFTVYGPRQRPDLAIHSFARRMLAGQPLSVYGDGTTRRDYTFVDDIVAGIRSAMTFDRTPFEVINLGNNRTVSLSELIAGLEGVLGVPARIERLAEQPGDVPQTWASIEKARTLLGYTPRTALDEGLRRFADWLQGAPSR